MRRLIASIIVASLIITTTAQRQRPTPPSQCQPFADVDMCKEMPYNVTRLPNMYGHTNLLDVKEKIDQYAPLVTTGCSKHLKYFLCAAFTPMCSETVSVSITACRSVCEEVKAGCESLLLKYDWPWPEDLDCERFPLLSENALCMHIPPEHSDSGSQRDNMKEVNCPFGTRQRGDDKWLGGECSPMCDAPIMFSTGDKETMLQSMGIFAIICAVITMFTVATFVLQPSRFRFPERSIVFMAVCYHIYSWLYILRAYIIEPFSISCTGSGSGHFLMIDGTDNRLCALNFIIGYVVTTAASVWWLILTITWYLTTTRGWTGEGMDSYSAYFHFAAWGSPIIACIVILLCKKVGAFELTSMCSAGNSDWRMMVGIQILPSSLVLATGLAFIIGGFCEACRLKNMLRRSGQTDVVKFERLIAKIGLFCALYIIPAGSVIAGNAYHAYTLYQWEKHFSSGSTARPERPETQVFVVQMLMQFLLGGTTGLWILSTKTLRAWGDVLLCRPSSPVKSELKVQSTMQPMMVTAGAGSYSMTSSHRMLPQHPMIHQSAVHMQDPACRRLINQAHLYS